MTDRHLFGAGVWLWGAAVVLLTSVPYVYLAGDAGHFAPEGSTYNWLLPPYVEDGLAYAAWVKQAASGSLMFKVKFTQMPHGAILVQPFFLLVGWLSAITGWQAGFALFASRIAVVALFLVALYWFTGLFPLSTPQRRIALALASVSSGLGGLLPAGVPASADLWMPEINTLWSLTWNPLFATAMALMLGAIGSVVVATAEGRTPRTVRGFLVAGALTGLLALVHAYDVLVVAPIVFVVTAVRLGRAMIGPLLAFAAVVLPPCAWQWAIVAYHPILSAHTVAGVMPSPALWSYLLALGLPAALAMYGGVRIQVTGLGRAMLPLGIWIAASLLFAYAPVWFQRKLMMGVHLPVCMIAAVGLDDLARRVSTGRKWAYAGVVVASLAFTAVTHVRNFEALRNEVRQDVGAFYVTPDLRQAFRFLEEHTDPDSVVLAAYEATRLIPGAAGNTVTYGHWAQSIDLQAHVAWLRRVFGPPGAMSAADRQRELRESAIDYVFIDQTMLREWLRGRIPEWLATVGATVYSGPGVRIIEVAKEHGKR